MLSAHRAHLSEASNESERECVDRHWAEGHPGNAGHTRQSYASGLAPHPKKHERLDRTHATEDCAAELGLQTITDQD